MDEASQEYCGGEMIPYMAVMLLIAVALLARTAWSE